jgi:hypothetical protein
MKKRQLRAEQMRAARRATKVNAPKGKKKTRDEVESRGSASAIEA